MSENSRNFSKRNGDIKEERTGFLYNIIGKLCQIPHKERGNDMNPITEHRKPLRRERIIQFGSGGFLRGFFDWMVQKINETSDFDGSVVVVRSIDRAGDADAFAAQNHLYTHLMRGAEGVERTLVDVISRSLNANREYDAYLALADAPDFRFVVSNTTESGIVFSASDRMDDAPPSTFPAKVTALLWRRYKNGLPGFIFLPCELIERNGDTLRACILRYGELWGLGADFKRFVECENVFCNTLVDRINTGFPKGETLNLGYTDAFVNTSEFYHLLVIETDFDIERELPFSMAGLNVIVTRDKLETYRTRKVRILNGAHTSLVPYALLSGFETVRECVENADMNAYLRRAIFDEIIPTLDLPREELEEYAESVLVRFSNPYIKHYLSDISLNSVSKFRVRVLPSILAYIDRFGRMPETLIFAFANLLAFYRTDRTRDSVEVTAFMKTHTTREILASAELWGRDLSFLADAVEGAL